MTWSSTLTLAVAVFALTPGPAVIAGMARALGAGFAAGLLVTLGNPKVILFYVGFLPAVFDLGRLGPIERAPVATLVASVLMAVNGGYAWSACRVDATITSRRAARRLNRGAAAVVAGTGAAIVAR
jgi:threonine/homoserine/homoserine lactone efflux protein